MAYEESIIGRLKVGPSYMIHDGGAYLYNNITVDHIQYY